MQVDVVIEQRFFRCKNNKFWTENAFPNAFWNRYLMVFSEVNIVARVESVKEPELNWKRVDGDSVNLISLPCYIGPIGFAKSLPRLISILRSRAKIQRKVIFRVPGILSSLYQVVSISKKQSYGVEVVGDPADVFAPGASRSILRIFFKFLFTKMLKNQCKGAVSISYVTEYSLQAHYPPHPDAFQTHYSSIQLSNLDYTNRVNYEFSNPIQIICIGNLTQPYKGCDFMLETLAKLNDQGVVCQLTWIGGGYLMADMQVLALKLGVENIVNFLGNIADREEIRAEIDKADLFVLSSRQEGLPRVLIESMARSLVCVATNVGGVKELLAPEYIVEKDNCQQLINVIKNLTSLSNEALLNISHTNYKKAQEYEDTVLTERRKLMFQHLLDKQ